MLKRLLPASIALCCLILQPALADSVGDFARCLKQSGATYYGTWWCPYCKKQNELFGRAKAKLSYVECSAKGSREKLARCAAVQAFPTWIFTERGKERGRVTGVQSFERLAYFSGCAAPQV